MDYIKIHKKKCHAVTLALWLTPARCVLCAVLYRREIDDPLTLIASINLLTHISEGAKVPGGERKEGTCSKSRTFLA